VSPGTSGTGTLRAAGDLSFVPGSTYSVDVDATDGTSDLLTAGGSATIAGGTVVATIANAGAEWQNDFTILSAAGGVSGSFDSVTSNVGTPFLTPELSYSSDAVTLSFTRNDVTFARYASTANGVAAANALDALPEDSTLYGAVVTLDGAAAGKSFDALAGSIHASLKTGMIEDTRYVRDIALEHANAATRFGAGGASSTGLWVKGFGGQGSLGGSGEATELDHDTGGLLIGADRTFGAHG
ncbi:autotransporter outer membrane beta-barrel domain-containing protein, partial [Thioclava sp. BHET1]